MIRFKASVKVRVRSSDRRSTDAPSPTGEQERLFQPAAERYRRRLAKVVLSGVAGFLLTGLSLVVPGPFLKAIAIPGVCCIALSLALFFTLPALPCPTCGKATDSGFDAFCLACGSGGLRVSRLWGTHCDACDRSLGSYKYRNYRVRYCTHCGALVHSAGV